MDQELEYAQMLEVPVSTVNVVKKKHIFKKKEQKDDDVLKEQVVDSVNERMGDYVYAEDLTVPPKAEKGAFAATLADKSGKILIIEVAAACLLAIGIFLTNVFMPNSAINSFIIGLTAEEVTEAVYSEFELYPVVSELSDAEVSVSESGVITFTGEGAVYPVAGGEVAAVTQGSDGTYSVEVAHTSIFRSVVGGLTNVYYSVGDEVAGNITGGYSDGSSQVSVSMYNDGELLNCYTLTGALPVWNTSEVQS